MRLVHPIGLIATLFAAPAAALDAIDIEDRGEGYFSVVGPLSDGPDGYFHVYCAAARAAERRGLGHVALLSAISSREASGAPALNAEFFAGETAAAAAAAGSPHPTARTDAMIAAYCRR